MNYEEEVKNILITELQKKFNIYDEQILYLYLKIRYYIIYDEKNILDKTKFIKFLLKELNIVDFFYKDIYFSMYADENNYSNIIDDFEYRYYKRDYLDKVTNKTISMIEKEKNILDKLSQIKIKNKKDKNIKNFYTLKKLNELFSITINKISILEDFHQQEDDILENKLEQYIKLKDINSNSIQDISELDLENYLIQNLNLIEDGLKYLTRQYELDEGRIDILAEDSNNNLVIIELKIEEDKKIIWQSIYYPMQMKKKTNKKIRMILIAPKYSNYILEPLNTLNVEKYSYDITIKNKKIIDLKIKKGGN